jgi:N-methylhydantoinase A
MSAGYRIGVDVGGTFTDIVAIDDRGGLTFLKTPTIPGDQATGVLDGLSELASRLGLSLEDLFARTQRIVHGTTVATNALIERKGVRTALLTTAGHRDVLEMREGLKPDRYNLRLPPLEPLVPREWRSGISERLRADGSVLVKLDPASLAVATERLRNEKIESVAVCYLHAYRNARHESETLAHLERELPNIHVSLSSEVLPHIKEYERVSTTVVNAYVGPIVDAYLAKLEDALGASGYRGRLFIILSHGGVAPVAEARRLAAATVLSGPAGGIAGCKRAAEICGSRNIIPFDMGGTSTDISLIVNGEAALTSSRGLAGQRIALRSLDIVSIGAGGGSIARASGGALEVGPMSAGARPGPVSYGAGGTEPTVTDANLVLGRLDAARPLPGRGTLDLAAAEAALDRLGGELGLSRERVAEGIIEIIDVKMADAIRLATVAQGVDPREFTLLSFGGAAGQHACGVARQLELKRIIVPNFASVLSAWGMLATPLRYETSRTYIGDMSSLSPETLRSLFGELESAARQKLEREPQRGISTYRSAQMRYGEQIYEVDVPLDRIDWSAANLFDLVTEAFHRRHEELFTYSLPGQDVVLVNARVAVTSAAGTEFEPAAIAPGAAKGPTARRKVHRGRWLEVPVYAMNALVPEQAVVGPALVESDTTTVLLHEGDAALVNRFGWLEITIDG